MFCNHCGKQLEGESKFCMFCGKPLQPAAPATPAEPAAPVITGEPAAPVVPVIPAESAAPQIPLDPQIDLYPETAPVQEFPHVPVDANVYSDPKPPVMPKKKGGKKGLIIAIVVVLVLAIAGGVGFYLYTQHVYEENLAAYEAADLLQQKGDYDGALEGFLALEDFEDAASRAKKLQKLQEAYDEAVQMLLDKKFDEARRAFEDLGDYRDSKNYVENEITYLEAYENMTAGNYVVAAELFASLSSYSDAADLASECWLQYAMELLQAGEYDAALACQENMEEQDVAALQEAYAEVCADGAFLQTLKEAIILWYDEDNQFTYEEELSLAWDMVQPYEGAYFNDKALADRLADFQYALQIMYNALYDDTSVDLWSEYYLGEYFVFALVDQMYNEYGLFADDAYYVDMFVGVADLYYAYSCLEYSLENWWDNTAVADQMDDGHYYATYTNDTDYSFYLWATIYFYDSNGNLLETGDEMSVYVAKGATVYIPVIPETISDNDWYTWGMFWDFSDVS